MKTRFFAVLAALFMGAVSLCTVLCGVTLLSDVAPVVVQFNEQRTGLVVARLSGIQQRRIETTGHWEGYTLTMRPKLPQDCVVDLWTADGRHWQAQWVESKP